MGITAMLKGPGPALKILQFYSDRITASNFGIVLKAFGRERYCASLFRRLLQEYTQPGF